MRSCGSRKQRERQGCWGSRSHFQHLWANPCDLSPKGSLDLWEWTWSCLQRKCAAESCLEKLSDTAGRLPKSLVEFIPSKQRRVIICLVWVVPGRYQQKNLQDTHRKYTLRESTLPMTEPESPRIKPHGSSQMKVGSPLPCMTLSLPDTRNNS